MTADEIDGPHQQPQPEQQRTAASGQRANVKADGVSLSSGGGATLLAIRWRRGGYPPGWVFYLDTDPKRAIFLTDTTLAPFLHTIVNTA